MVKDGEHDKTQMVNKCTFNNNNHSNSDDDSDGSDPISSDLHMCLFSFSAEI